MTTETNPRPRGSSVAGTIALLALDAARRRHTVWAPPAVATLAGVAAPVLHAAWWLLGLPWVLAHAIGALGAVLAWSTAMHRRAGPPRYLALAAWCVGITWTWTVWAAGPSLTAYRVLVVALAVAWPTWLWWCWWRGKISTVPDGENHFRVVRGPQFEVPTLARLARKLRRRRNRREHRRAQARREHERRSAA